MARELNVRGLMNVQFAVKGDDVYVLEVNPRASRTVPFVSKAIGVPLAKLAAKVMTGKTLRELGFTKEIVPKHFSVKEAGLPVPALSGRDISLGPEMKSTGEVMGIDADLGLAYAKSQMAAPPPLPKGGNVFISVKDDRQGSASFRWRDEFVALGFGIIATSGTAATLQAAGIPVHEGFQTSRRPTTRARPRQERRHQFHHQHAERKNSARGRSDNSQCIAGAENPDHDHHARRAGERERNSLAPKKPAAVKSLQEYHARCRTDSTVTSAAHSCHRCSHETNIALLPDGIGPRRSLQARSEEQKKRQHTPMNASRRTRWR